MAQRTAASTTPISTRFDKEELEILKQAADKKQWSIAQLVRVGAYEKAVNVLNSTGHLMPAVRSLLGEVIEQLLEPKVVHSRPHSVGAARMDFNTFGHDFCQSIEYEGSLRLSALDEATLERFIKAIRGLGSELADLLSEEINRRGASDPCLMSEMIDPALPPSKGTSSGAPAHEVTQATPQPRTKRAKPERKAKRGKGA